MKLYDETDYLPPVEPAFPCTKQATATRVAEAFPGLTKREYAAIHIAAAITGGLAAASISTTDDDVATIAKASVRLADAVLREAGE